MRRVSEGRRSCRRDCFWGLWGVCGVVFILVVIGWLVVVFLVYVVVEEDISCGDVVDGVFKGVWVGGDVIVVRVGSYSG